MPKGSTKHKLALKGDTKMNTLARYNAADLPVLMKRINEYSIGMDDYLERIFGHFNETNPNYPPYNLIQVSNVESRLEIALAGFKKEELNVYTEYGKLFIEGQKESKESDTNYVHKGLAQRSFKRTWSMADDTEIGDVSFEDGLLVIKLNKVVPEHHSRKDYI